MKDSEYISPYREGEDWRSSGRFFDYFLGQPFSMNNAEGKFKNKIEILHINSPSGPITIIQDNKGKETLFERTLNQEEIQKFLKRDKNLFLFEEELNRRPNYACKLQESKQG